MKSKIYTLLALSFFLLSSCSSDDDSNNNSNEATISELLVDHGIWAFTDLNLIEVRDAGPSNINIEDMEVDLIDDFLGTTILFNSDFTGTLTNPQAQSPFTWQLNDNDNVIITSAAGDPIVFDNVTVTALQLRLNTEVTFYDFASDYDVVTYGTFVFQ